MLWLRAKAATAASPLPPRRAARPRQPSWPPGRMPWRWSPRRRTCSRICPRRRRRRRRMPRKPRGRRRRRPLKRMLQGPRRRRRRRPRRRLPRAPPRQCRRRLRRRPWTKRLRARRRTTTPATTSAMGRRTSKRSSVRRRMQTTRLLGSACPSRLATRWLHDVPPAVDPGVVCGHGPRHAFLRRELRPPGVCWASWGLLGSCWGLLGASWAPAGSSSAPWLLGPGP
mmetsp:Transcript_7759/g.19993  ORF Transcript_7759/g.19993 Transcript_7759/m.19993 type:complete len:226 (+) Transcript_7759:153-830(+)